MTAILTEDAAVRRLLPLARSLAGRYSHRYRWHHDDALSEAFLGVLQAVRADQPGRAGPVSLRSLARQIIERRLLDGLRARHGRSRRKHLPLSLEGISAPLADEPPVGADLENRDEVEYLLRHLKPRTRRMLWNHFALGLTIVETGRREGLREVMAAAILKQSLEFVRAREEDRR